jgi:processive rubber oxygenase RoxA-like protein
MKLGRFLGVLVAAATVTASAVEDSPGPVRTLGQVPTWSKDDLNFFLHGSMSTEVVPEAVLRAFIKTYPDLFPTSDLSHLGLIPDSAFTWPIGFSRKAEVKHLGNLPAVGINCASCHVAQITSTSGSQPIRILGVTSHFNVEAFFGSVLVATFKTSDPANMKKFLAMYLALDPNADKEAQQILGKPDVKAQALFESEWQKQEQKINARIAFDPFASKNVGPGELHTILPGAITVDGELIANGLDLAELSHTFLKLFHNMRAALHVPDQPPEKVPPASGPGRNDAFGLLAASLLHAPQPYSPIKFGLVWNVGKRTWVHWDGNTKSPIARNLLASLGLGAPMHGKHGDLIFADVKRQTDLSEKIAPPKYPFKIDNEAAKRGAPLFKTNCNSCHGGPESDKRLFPVAEVGTDPHRAEMFTQKLADGFNKFLAELEAEGYQPPKESGVRSTGKYFAATLSGVWARSPYLHNGSVRTMQELLTPPSERAKTFHRGSRVFDEREMGYTNDGAYVLDTSDSGNSNSGHDYGTKLSAGEKHDLIEYLKTL